MAAMDQGKLNTMVSEINSCADEYERVLIAQSKQMLDAFNNNWVSNSSRKLATEIKSCLDSLATCISTVFNNKNEDIRTSVLNFNSIESENITYTGFSFGIPSVNLELNQTLPNGKVGVSDNADLKAINVPMENLVVGVTNVLDTIVNKVKAADALDAEEQEALTQRILNIKSDFNKEMEDRKSELTTRMQGEISAREELRNVNLGNLGQ